MFKYAINLVLLTVLSFLSAPVDARQRVASVLAPQAISVDQDVIRVNNIGNLSTIGAPSGATFTILNNPGNYFSIVGTEIVANPATPAGQYSITVQASGGGLTTPIKKTFALNYARGSPPPTPHFFQGTNLSGMENIPPSQPPSIAQVGYFVSNNISNFRLPINWNNIQPTINTALDPTYVASLHAALANIHAAGGVGTIDLHNFGNCPTGFGPVGSGGCPIAAFVDLWTRIATEFGSDAGLYGLDLMNEWFNGFPFQTLFDAQQQAITAVRGLGYAGFIYAEGTAFTGTWNWVSGQGNAYNNNLLWQLSDPVGKLKFEGHMYYDRDNSGTHFSYAIESASPGFAPPGTPTNPTIGVTRLAPWVQWGAQNNVTLNYGEGGVSPDAYGYGGNLNFQAWNVMLDNAIAVAKANNVEYWYWGNGPGFTQGFLGATLGYGYNSEPFSSGDLTTKDYTSAGVQAPQMAVLRRSAGSTQPQPVAYALVGPSLVTSSGNPERPNVSPINYFTPSVASAPLQIYYGGEVPSPVTITPHDTLMDGTSAGGTFTPATITLATGENALVSFTYTPSQAATIRIATTNNAGWIDPPALGFSSLTDQYTSLPSNTLANIYGMYNRYTPNIFPSLLLQRSSDGQMMNWSATLPNSAGLLGFDRAALQTWANARTGIKIIRKYDASPARNHLTFNFATNLVGSILGTTLTLSSAPVAPAIGQFLVDDTLKIAPGTTIVSGGGLVWTVSISQTVASEAMQSVDQNGVFPTLTLNNSAGYPEIVATLGVKGDFNTPITGQSAMSIIARINQTSGNDFFRIDRFSGPIYWSGSDFEVINTGWLGQVAPGSAVQLSGTNLNITTGSYGDYGFVYKSNLSTGNRTFKNGSVTATSTTVGSSFTGTAGPGNTLVVTSVTGTIRICDAVFGNGVPAGSPTYVTGQISGTTGGAGTYQLNGPVTSSSDALTSSYVLNPAFGQGSVHFNYFQFGSQNWVGSFTNLEFEQGLALSDSQAANIMAADATYYSTALPDVLPGLPPGVTGVLTSQAIYPSLYHNIFAFLGGTGGSNPAGGSGIIITDANSGSPTDTITITLSGAGGTLSGAGISGTGPYTIAADTAANVTATLHGALFAPGTSTPGDTTTFTILVNSSAGTSTTVAPNVVITTYVADTPLSVPANSFSAINTFGVNLAGAESPSSSAPTGIFPPNFEANYFATLPFGLIRLPFTSQLLQTTAFAPLNASYVAKIKAVVDNCLANNQIVILDVHDTGGNVWNSKYGVKIDAAANNGSDLFQDEWRRLATLFKNYPNVWFGLMNEPTQPTAVQWRDGGVIPAVTAIRAVGATQKITIPGIAFASARDFVANGSAAAFTGFSADPLNNFIFEAHQYLDGGNSGQSPVATQSGATILVAMTAWLTTNSYQALLGEFGVAPDPFHPLSTNILSWDQSQAPITTNSLTQNGNMLAYMKTNRAQWPAWTVWTGGAFGQIPNFLAYGYNVEPLINGSGTGFTVPIVDQQMIPTLIGGM